MYVLTYCADICNAVNQSISIFIQQLCIESIIYEMYNITGYLFFL